MTIKSRLAGTLILVHLVVAAFCQEVVPAGYAATAIAESLKKDANAVYRLDEAELNVLSPSKYTMKVHRVITILNAEGAEHLQQVIWFDKFNSVDDIEVKLYNSLGIEMQKYRKKDFTVMNYYDGFSLATDDKMMRLSLNAAQYPCTVEVLYTTSVSAYIDLPDSYLDNASSSIEQFRYTVKVLPEMDIRYRSLNIDLEPVIENNGKTKIYKWEAQNIAVSKIETGGYEGSRYLPKVEVSPTVFEYDGYKGDFKTWSDFGKWCYSLYDEKTPFTAKRVAEIKELVKDRQDTESKIGVLYEYLKKNMRYVSIQFGIGGYKPFATSFVDEKKYGDCKALTNYMRNLLAVAGIKSYPALINAGYNKAPAPANFPENIFNHVILCVPGAQDSIWLECTSNNSDPGFLGSFTENKNALLLTENGGILVPTPRSNFNKSTLTTVNHVYLDAEGGAEVLSSLTSTGSFYDLLDQVSKMETDKLNELFVTHLHYKEPDVLTLLKETDTSDTHRLNVKFTYARLFDFKAGEKYFFPKSISRLCNEKLLLLESRKSEYIFRYPYKKIDTTIFHLPKGFTIENIPPTKELSNQFVMYKREANFDNTLGTVKIISDLFLKKNIILPGQYKEVSELFDAIGKEEGNKLVLKKGGD